MSNFYPPEGHDFVGTAEVRRLEQSNDVLFTANLLGQMALFRAEVSELLSRAGAFDSLTVLALYHAESNEYPMGDEAGVLLACEPIQQPTEIVVGVFSYPDRTAPVIRVITNEPVFAGGQEGSYIVEDVSVDDENDAQYGLGVLFLAELEPGQSPSYPCIQVRDGIISMSFAAFTPTVDVHPNRYDQLYPLGHYKVPRDKLYALQRAREIISRITTPPVVINVSAPS